MNSDNYLFPSNIEKIANQKRICASKLEIGQAGEVNNNGCYYLRAGKDCFLMICEHLGFIPYTLSQMDKDGEKITVEPVKITFSITTR